MTLRHNLLTRVIQSLFLITAADRFNGKDHFLKHCKDLFETVHYFPLEECNCGSIFHWGDDFRPDKPNLVKTGPGIGVLSSGVERPWQALAGMTKKDPV
jgi:hypothetical protein